MEHVILVTGTICSIIFMKVLPVHNVPFASGALIVNLASSPPAAVSLVAVRILLPSIEKAVNSPPSGVVQL